VTQPGYQAIFFSRVASSVTDNFGNRDNLRAGERRSKRKSGSSLILWGRRDTQAVTITSVTEVIEVIGYQPWCGVLREANVAPTAASSSCHSPKRSLVMCTPPEARGSILRACDYPLREDLPQRDPGANKGSICRYNMLDSLLKVSPLRAWERGRFNQVRGRCSLRTSP
jgi:hypothetical protein